MAHLTLLPPQWKPRLRISFDRDRVLRAWLLLVVSNWGEVKCFPSLLFSSLHSTEDVDKTMQRPLEGQVWGALRCTSSVKWATLLHSAMAGTKFCLPRGWLLYKVISPPSQSYIHMLSLKAQSTNFSLFLKGYLLLMQNPKQNRSWGIFMLHWRHINSFWCQGGPSFIFLSLGNWSLALIRKKIMPCWPYSQMKINEVNFQYINSRTRH